MTNPTGEAENDILRIDFDRRIMVPFRGSVVTSVCRLSDGRGRNPTQVVRNDRRENHCPAIAALGNGNMNARPTPVREERREICAFLGRTAGLLGARAADGAPFRAERAAWIA